MKRAAVLGSPIAHSLSPTLHAAGYAACGLDDWEYGRREVTATELVAVVTSLDDSWRGLSLTMPLKEAAFEVAASVSEVATRAGAINTLVRRSDAAWDATNTDVGGIVESLRPYVGDRLDGATVLGAGATARSAVLALAELGAGSIVVRARRPEAAEELGRWAADTVGLPSRSGLLTDWADGEALVVSTLPAGVGDGLARDLPAADGVLLDVVYANWPTPIATAAQRLGWTVVSGLDMLVHQAAAQFELFTGVEAPIEAMFAAGRAALGRV